MSVRIAGEGHELPVNLNPAAVFRVLRLSGRLGPYVYLVPAVAVFILFLAFPVGFAFWLALHTWNGLTPINDARYVGLSNFRYAVTDPIFREALRNSVFFTVMSTVIQMIVAFFLSFTIWFYKPRFARLLRSLYFFPTILSSIMIGLLWRQMLTIGGPINSLGSGIGLHNVLWLSNPSLVMWVVIWVSSWQWSGWTMVLYLAGMLGIPNEVIEAARLDGSSGFQIMRTIVFPMVRYATGLALLLNVIGGFQVFDTIYVMTGGGPDHASEVLGTYSYWEAFSALGPGQLGYAATIAVVMVIILFVFSYFRVKLSRLV
jgi:ABC-type sugar transport system permease subunit